MLLYFDSNFLIFPHRIFPIFTGKVTIGECGTYASDTGIYEFTLGAKDNAKVKARYSYLYVYEDGQWKIAHHHSSKMPEAVEGSDEDEITEEGVRNLFELWNTALDTLDSDCVAKRYADGAVLLPTVSDTPRTDYDSIKDYFDNFLKLKPQGKIIESYVSIGDGFATDKGIYEFTMRATGDVVRARYTYIYTKDEDGVWKIAHHHSSAMPEAGAKKDAAPTIEKEQVGKLFYLWNDALATLDSDKVAQRYSKNGVLLPTVSDTPRADYDSIKDYFDAFLQKKPQGEIVQSFCSVGEGTCSDVGIYDFTMGSDGSKVRARYSFVYVYEDGEWKISHHHSSVMPEAMLAAAAAAEEKVAVAN